MQAQYTNYPGYWGGLSSERRGGTSRFYGVDQQSSVRILVGATGVVTDSYAYRAFGTEWQSGNGSRNSYRYVGQYGYYRDSAAMQYVRARYLDVQAGSWVSRDPIHIMRNLYNYVENMPLILIDASGMIPSNGGTCSNKPSCGPRIDLLLTNTITEVKAKFARSNPFSRMKHCDAITSGNPITLGSAWDIVQLSNRAGDPHYE